MAPPTQPSVPWDVIMKKVTKPARAPGTYWFAMTQRYRQTGWMTPADFNTAKGDLYNPYGDPATQQPSYKETFLSDAIEIRADAPWDSVEVRVGRDTQPRPEYFQATSTAQHGRPFPIAPQSYHAFYVSHNRGRSWQLFATHAPSFDGPYAFSVQPQPVAPSAPVPRSSVRPFRVKTFTDLT